MELNDMQKAVVDHRPGDGALLVTAAAGSGKTAVVVERVFRLISREQDPIDISRLLVITFTNAAAQEMRGRISRRLYESLQGDPSSRLLNRQIRLLDNADIMTIDAFFLKLVREHFSSLGISPEARIADQDETDGIAGQVMDDLLEEKYRQGSASFLNLVDMLTKRQEDRELSELILRVYRTFQSMPEPEKQLRDMVEPFSRAQAGNSVWVDFLLERSKKELVTYLRNCRRAISEMEGDTALEKAYLPAFISDRDQLEKLLQIGRDWDKLREELNRFTPQKLGALRGYNDEGTKQRLQAVRKISKDGIEALKERFEDSTEEIMSDMHRLLPAMEELADLILLFGKRFTEEKNRRKLLEFDDVAQYVYRLLWRNAPDGSKVPTREAETLRGLYDEVIVDEYQDTNRLQDEIFHAFTGNASDLLMVGDVKQSIYGFRNADPEGFVEKLNRYAPLGDDRSKNHRQALNLNYRSSEGVIAGVNFLFGRLMKKEYGGIEYDDGQKLAAGRTDTVFHPTELRIVRVEEEQETREAEAEQVALYIKNTLRKGLMIDSPEGRRRVRYGDFAVLMRSAKDRMPIYERALRNHGIPARASRTQGLYSTPEGETVLSILWVVDNPYNDVALLAVLSSAAFGFSPSELASIRLYDRKLPFIEVMRKAAEAGNEKCRDFLLLLGEWRNLRIREKLGIFIRRIYDRLSLPILAQQSDNGEDRVANLYELAHRAEAYEGRGGLSAFLKSVARAIEGGKEPDGVKGEEADNEVVLMTVHQSKGLQFPVVLLVDTATPFSTRSFADSVIFRKEMGFGFRVQDPEKRIRYDTVTHRAVKCRAQDAEKEEELRVLYVALTRAMEKNVIFASFSKPEKKIGEISAKVDPDSIIGDFSSCAEWVIACLLDSREGDDLINEVGGTAEVHTESSGMEWSLGNLGEAETAEPVENEKKPEKKDSDGRPPEIAAPYSCGWAVGLPTKLTATELKQSVKNHELYEENEEIKRHQVREEVPKPSFMEKHGMSAARKGTALHLAMQLIDLQKTDSTEKIGRELVRLTEEGYITQEDAKTVRTGLIWSFFNSDLGKRMRSSPKVYREMKFTLSEDAGNYREGAAGKGEKLLLQGIIDCAFIEGEELVLVDYKSDRLAEGEDPHTHAVERGYPGQLSVYRRALERMTGLKVRECWIYYLSARRAVELS